MAEGRYYSDEEVRAILDRALKHELERGTAYDDLLAAASEVGISPAALEQAVREIEENRDAERARERILARRRRAFMSHLWTFVGVQVFLFALNWLTTPWYLWFIYPLLAWGLGLFLHARSAFSKEVSDRALNRELKKMGVRKRSERSKAYAIDKAAAELGAALEEGAGMLISKIATQVRGRQPERRVRLDERGPGAAPPGPARVDTRPAEESLRADEAQNGEARRSEARRN
ncbi:MAG TPA: 2TM domain-containing protein [Polyangiaceae bacterium]|nr:2TM domain-containing protein [Polyangiaceae bacterium]